MWGYIGYDENVAVGTEDDSDRLDCRDEIAWEDALLDLLIDYEAHHQ